MDGCIDCGEMYRQQVNIYTDGRDMVYGQQMDGGRFMAIYGRQVNGQINGDWIDGQIEKMIQFSFVPVIEQR